MHQFTWYQWLLRCIKNSQFSLWIIGYIVELQHLIEHYQSGSDPQNITNFMITGDLVNSHYYKQLGQEIRLSVLNDLELTQFTDTFTYYQNYWVKDGSEQSQDLSSVFAQHSPNSFSYDKLNEFSVNQLCELLPIKH